MITTPEVILDRVSARLNESSTVETAQRLSYFDQAVQAVVDYSKFPWTKKEGTITGVADDQEYDMTSEFADYNTEWGLDIVYLNSVQIYPVEYEDKALFSTARFALTPDNQNVYFTQTVASGDTFTTWYFRSHTAVTAKDTTLNIPLPEAMSKPIVLYVKHLVHDGKRQRNDARNAILDFQETMEEIVMQKGSKKAKGLAKNIVNPLRYANIRRNYATH